MYLYLSVFISDCRSFYSSISIFISLSISTSVYLSTGLSIHLYIYLLIFPSLYSYSFLSFYLPIYLFIFPTLSICFPIYLSIHYLLIFLSLSIYFLPSIYLFTCVYFMDTVKVRLSSSSTYLYSIFASFFLFLMFPCFIFLHLLYDIHPLCYFRSCIFHPPF